jgi:hypothetical protein
MTNIKSSVAKILLAVFIVSGSFAIALPSNAAQCTVNGALPDSGCTPGFTLPVTAAQVCVSGYSKSVRNVTTKTKNAVFAEYGITSHPTGAYEVDHLISLELGGSNDIKNLFPEAASPTPGFHEKDKVENYLHSQVCLGKISLKTAQHEIATNWLSVKIVTAKKAVVKAPAKKSVKKPVAIPIPTPTPYTYNYSYTPTPTPQSSSTSSVPIGATAQCNDGSYSYSQTHSGSCSHHGGVASWL